MKKNLIKLFIIGSLLSTAVNFCFADTGRHIYNYTGDSWMASFFGGRDTMQFQNEKDKPACDTPLIDCLVPPAPGPHNDIFMSYQGITKNERGDWQGFITFKRVRDGAAVTFSIACDNGGEISQGNIFKFTCRASGAEPNPLYNNEVNLNPDGDITISPQ